MIEYLYKRTHRPTT